MQQSRLNLVEVKAGKIFHHNQQEEGGGASSEAGAAAAALLCVDQWLCCVAHIFLCSISQIFGLLLSGVKSSRNEVILFVCEHFRHFPLRIGSLTCIDAKVVLTRIDNFKHSPVNLLLLRAARRVQL